jgi:hypothetical protein
MGRPRGTLHMLEREYRIAAATAGFRTMREVQLKAGVSTALFAIVMAGIRTTRPTAEKLAAAVNGDVDKLFTTDAASALAQRAR